MNGLESEGTYNISNSLKVFISSSLYMRYHYKFLPQINFIWEFKYISIRSNFDFEVKVVFTTNGLYFLLSRISTSADQTGRIFYKGSH